MASRKASQKARARVCGIASLTMSMGLAACPGFSDRPVSAHKKPVVLQFAVADLFLPSLSSTAPCACLGLVCSRDITGAYHTDRFGAESSYLFCACRPHCVDSSRVQEQG